MQWGRKFSDSPRNSCQIANEQSKVLNSQEQQEYMEINKQFKQPIEP